MGLKVKLSHGLQEELRALDEPDVAIHKLVLSITRCKIGYCVNRKLLSGGSKDGKVVISCCGVLISNGIEVRSVNERNILFIIVSVLLLFVVVAEQTPTDIGFRIIHINRLLRVFDEITVIILADTYFNRGIFYYPIICRVSVYEHVSVSGCFTRF